MSELKRAIMDLLKKEAGLLSMNNPLSSVPKGLQSVNKAFSQKGGSLSQSAIKPVSGIKPVTYTPHASNRGIQ